MSFRSYPTALSLLFVATCLLSPLAWSADSVVLTANAGANRTAEGLKSVVLDGGQSAVTKGTASGWVVSHANGYPIGETVIDLANGTGTFLIGDTVRFAGDNTDYVISNVAGSTLTLAAPGLTRALADATTVTVSTAIVAWRWTRQDTGASLGSGSALAVSLRGTEGNWGEAAGAYNVLLTVEDSAGHTATDTLVITVTTGAAPTADAGGPYEGGAGGPPVFFNGGNSTDDHGIVDYIWETDVPQGGGIANAGSATLRGRTPMYTYATAGTTYARLTVQDGRGQSSSTIIPVTVQANLPPQVSTIPYKGNPNLPHPALSGVAVQLRGVARDAGALTYRWSFGDGTYDPPLANPPAAVTNARAIEASHAYAGDPGKPYVATLTVYDGEGRASFATTKIRIEADTAQMRSDMATERALWWLHKNQAQSPLGQWSGYSDSYPSATASALQAFCINGARPSGDARINPYCETVQNGFDYLLASCIQAYTTAGSTTPNGDPWTGNATSLTAIGSDHPVYETGMVIDALAATEMPLGLVTSGSQAGRRYVDVVRDLVNMYVWGQSPGGGWYYRWNEYYNDNSASQWAAIGMKAAEDVFGITAPAYAKNRNKNWMTESYNPNFNGKAIFGYTSNYPIWVDGANTSPSALVQMAWNGTPSSDTRWLAVENSMRSWFTDGTSGYSNRNFYGLYAVAKSMHLAQPQRIDLLAGTFDWYGDASNGLRTRLITWQNGDGSWTGYCDNSFSYDLGGMATAWGVIMLSPNLFVQAPVAIQETPPAWGFDVPLQFDASRSFHIDPNKSIVQYAWDLDGDGSYEVTSNQPRSALARKTYADPTPGVSGDAAQTVTIRLRVTDAFGQSDVSQQTLIISEPPHAPFARPGGPYLGMEGFPVAVNASDSFDIDPTDFVTSYGWDWNNDGKVDDWTISPTISHAFAAPGEYAVGLAVKDNGVFNGGTPLTSLFTYATITVMPNQPPYAIIANSGNLTVGEGASLALDASGSYDTDSGQNVTCAWDLAYNGNTFNVTHTGTHVTNSWPDHGSQLIALRVSDGAKTTIVTTTVAVTDRSPTAGMTWFPFAPYRAQQVQFNDASTSPADAITGWAWDFGDSATASIQHPTHTYAATGTYTVTLTVTDDDGSTNATTRTITVSSDAVQISTTQLAVTEGGSSSTYTIQLSSVPSQPVTMTMTLPSRVQLVAGPASHVFTDTTPWTVMVQAVDDAVRQVTDPELQLITHATSCADATWNNLSVSNVQVSVNDNDFPGIKVSGNGLDISDGDATPAVADGTEFQTQRVGAAAVTQTFTIRNTGTVDMHLTGQSPVTVSGADAASFTVIQPTELTLTANATTTYTVRFTVPATVSTKTAVITIASDAPGALASYSFAVQGAAGLPTIAVLGNSVSITSGDVTPAPADGTAFGDAVVGGSAVNRTFTIQNAGGYPLNLVGTPVVALSGADAADFSVVTQPPNSPIVANGSIAVQIRFAPSALGLRNATITIASDDPSTPSFTCAIGGTGIQPAIRVLGGQSLIMAGDNTPAVADGTDFGTMNIIAGSVIHTFTIRNDGVGDLRLSEPRVSFSGIAASEFSVTTYPDAVLAPGASTDLAVAFNPAQDGLRSALMTITSNDPVTPAFTCTVAGTGITLPTPVISVTGNGIEIIGGADPMGGNYTYLGYAALRSPVSRSFTLKNTGDADMDVKNLVLKEATAADFSIILPNLNPPYTLTLVPGNSLTFDVVMTPSEAGIRATEVSIITAAETFTFPVRGYGLGVEDSTPVIRVSGTDNRDIADGSLSASLNDGTDFGSRGPGALSRIFTILNLGNTDLVLDPTTPVTITGTGAAAFTLVSPPASPVAPGGSTSFTLQFDPAALGSNQATITVVSSGHLDASLDQYTFTVAGRRSFIITGEPEDALDVPEDSTAKFKVTVDSIDPVTYQWQVQVADPMQEMALMQKMAIMREVSTWSDLAGETNAELKIQALAAKNNTYYRCLVSSGTASAASSSAQLTITVTPIAITQDPLNSTVKIGDEAKFTVVATGKAPLNYQWQSSPDSETFSDIVGATSATYTIPAATLAERGFYYQCVVTAGNGLTATSNSAQLSLTIPPPQITASSGPVTVFEFKDGDIPVNATFTVTATGTDLHFQWQYQRGVQAWDNITDALDQDSYTVTGATLDQDGTKFRCVVSDVDSVTATSESMVLIVRRIVDPSWNTNRTLPTLAVTGQTWQALVEANEGDGPVLPAEVKVVNPSWMRLARVKRANDSSTWTISGEPPTAGPTEVTLSASNRTGHTNPVTRRILLDVRTVAPQPVTLPAVPLGPPTGPAPYTIIGLSTEAGVNSWRQALGGRNATQARGFSWNPSANSYLEFPTEPAGGLTPYHAVFLATRVSLPLNLDGVPQALPGVLVLKPGWNLMSMPPLFDGSATLTTHTWSTTFFSLEEYDGTPADATRFIEVLGTPAGTMATTRPWQWNGSTYEQVDVLVSGVGYWFKNNAATNVRLIRGSSAAPAPQRFMSAAAASQRSAVSDRGQPPAPPGSGAGDGSFSTTQEADVGGGCGLGGGAAVLGAFLLLVMRLNGRGARR